jgi:hypothetical protein
MLYHNRTIPEFLWGVPWFPYHPLELLRILIPDHTTWVLPIARADKPAPRTFGKNVYHMFTGRKRRLPASAQPIPQERRRFPIRKTIRRLRLQPK